MKKPIVAGADTHLLPVKAQGGYDGASRMNRELMSWSPPVTSADGALLHGKDMADARMADAERNDGYIHGALNTHKDSVVGSAFRLNAKPDWKTLGLDETWAREFQSFVENWFTLYAESPENWLDARRERTFTGLVRLAIGSAFLAGESLSSAEWIRSAARPYKTAIQMIDPVRLSNPDGQADGPGLRKGIYRNTFGEAIRFAIREAVPSDIFARDSWRWKLVDARKPWGRKQILYYFDANRIDQSRGIADLVSALKGTKMAAKYKDVVLQNAVLNATYAASIESELPTAEVFASLGYQNTGTDTDVMSAWAINTLDAIAAYTGNSNNLLLDGVQVPHLYPGTKLRLQNAGQPGGVGTGFEESLLRYTAASLGMSYEEISQDFTKTNYSSFKAAGLNTHKRMMARKKTIADAFASDVFRLVFEEAFNAGDFKDVLPAGAPSIYDRFMLDAYTRCAWIGASRGQVDELKETNAAIARIKAGISTYEKECAKFGEDYREVFRQRYREQVEAKEMGLVLDLSNGGGGTVDAGGGAVDKAPKGTVNKDPKPNDPNQQDNQQGG